MFCPPLSTPPTSASGDACSLTSAILCIARNSWIVRGIQYVDGHATSTAGCMPLLFRDAFNAGEPLLDDGPVFDYALAVGIYAVARALSLSDLYKPGENIT